MTTMSRSRGVSTDMFLRMRAPPRAVIVARAERRGRPFSLVDLRCTLVFIRTVRCWAWQVASNRGKREDCLVIIPVHDHG